MDKKLRKFDTKVQYLKYKVLREVARHAWTTEGTEKPADSFSFFNDVAKKIVKDKPTMRCTYSGTDTSVPLLYLQGESYRFGTY